MYRQTCPTPDNNSCRLHSGPVLTPLCRPVHKLIWRLVARFPFPLVFKVRLFCPTSKVISSITAQTDAFIDASFQPGGIFRETQTSRMQSPAEDWVQTDQAVMCGDIFERVHSSYGVSTDNIISSSLVAETVTHDLLSQNHPKTLTQVLRNPHQL